MSRKDAVGKDFILQTAARLFIERGYRGVSIRDIARACQVTNAALYYYFPNKEALFWEVIHYHLAQLIHALHEARENASHPKEQLTAMLIAYTEWVLQKRASFFALRNDITSLAKKNGQTSRYPFHRQVTLIVEPFEAVLRQAEAEGRIAAPPFEASLGSLLLAMLHGVLHTQEEHPTDPHAVAEKTARWVVDVFWKGLAADNATATEASP